MEIVTLRSLRCSLKVEVRRVELNIFDKFRLVWRIPLV